jgi:hypothetical protein
MIVRALVVVAVPFLSIAATPDPALAQFPGDRDPCWVYAVAIKDAPMMTREEIRERLKRVYELARAEGNQKVWEASRAALTAATSGQGVREALNGLVEACRDRGSSAFPREGRSTPTAPISQDDAVKHLQGVLEREGVSGAKCRQKQYGSGWVTVCE